MKYNSSEKNFKDIVKLACGKALQSKWDNIIDIDKFSYLTNINMLNYVPTDARISICNLFFVKNKAILPESKMSQFDFVNLTKILKDINVTNNITMEYANALVNICNKYSKYNIKILINLENTKNLNLEVLKKLLLVNDNISIQVINSQLREVIGSEDYKACSYSPIEMQKIVKRMLSIESNICPNWSSIQKALYIRRSLYRNVQYKLDNVRNRSNEATLRGFINRKNVCAGYAVMFQEMLLRQGIPCEYANGNNHAWNIVNINGHLIPFDITWDSNLYYYGASAQESCVNIDEFIKKHIPNYTCTTQNYSRVLSGLSKTFVDMTNDIMFNRFTPVGLQYKVADSDGTSKFLAQIGGNREKDGKIYYHYYVQMLKKNNSLIGSPYLVKSPYSYSKAVCLENIEDLDQNLSPEKVKKIKQRASNQKNIFRDKLTAYLKTRKSNKNDDLKSVTYKRNDGSYIVIRDSGKKFTLNQDAVNQYLIYEYLKGTLVITKIYTPPNLDLINTYIPSKNIDRFFNSERLYEISQKYSGYIYGGLEDTLLSKRIISCFDSKRRIEPSTFSKAETQVDYSKPITSDGEPNNSALEEEQISMGR